MLSRCGRSLVGLPHQLAETSEPERFLDRLAGRCVAMAREFDERFRGSARLHDRKTGDGTDVNQVAAARALRRDGGNIRAVLGYALGPREPSAAPSAALLERWRVGAELAVQLGAYWQISGLLDEGRQWLSRAVDLFPETAQERAWALGARGRLATLQGDLGTAVADINESIRLAEAAEGGAELAARGYLYLNLALTFTGQQGGLVNLRLRLVTYLHAADLNQLAPPTQTDETSAEENR